MLGETLNDFPSDAEKERVLRSLDTLIIYFRDMQQRVESLPNSSRQKEVLDAINIIKDFLQSAIDNRPLAAALGLSYEKLKSSKRRREISPEVGKRLHDELTVLPTDQIQRKLLDYKGMSMEDLRALAAYMSIKGYERAKRQDLVDRIVKAGFANVRGYELLRTAEDRT